MNWILAEYRPDIARQAHFFKKPIQPASGYIFRVHSCPGQPPGLRASGSRPRSATSCIRCLAVFTAGRRHAGEFRRQPRRKARSPGMDACSSNACRPRRLPAIGFSNHDNGRAKGDAANCGRRLFLRISATGVARTLLGSMKNQIQDHQDDQRDTEKPAEKIRHDVISFRIEV